MSEPLYDPGFGRTLRLSAAGLAGPDGWIEPLRMRGRVSGALGGGHGPALAHWRDRSPSGTEFEVFAGRLWSRYHPFRGAERRVGVWYWTERHAAVRPPGPFYAQIRVRVRRKGKIADGDPKLAADVLRRLKR